jgi:hypothetical protein
MTSEQVYDALKKGPFPMRISLKDGRSFELPIRFMIFVGKRYVDIGVQAPDEEPGVCCDLVRCESEDVVRVESLSPSAA